jgi:hypothetical protein
LSLVKGFSRELVERYRFALDVAIHAPRDFPGSDPRNFHAHLLATTREVTTEGLGAKTTVEWSDANRRAAGLGPAINELLQVRQRWAEATNAALEEAHLSARIDHRTLAAQGIDREPAPHIPRAAFEMERHGYKSPVAERIREEYRARVESRQQRSAQLLVAAVEPRSIEELQKQSAENWRRWREAQPKLSTAELQKQSAENWRRWRESQAQPQPKPSQGRTKSRTRDHDHSL